MDPTLTTVFVSRDLGRIVGTLLTWTEVTTTLTVAAVYGYLKKPMKGLYVASLLEQYH